MVASDMSARFKILDRFVSVSDREAQAISALAELGMGTLAGGRSRPTLEQKGLTESWRHRNGGFVSQLTFDGRAFAHALSHSKR